MGSRAHEAFEDLAMISVISETVVGVKSSSTVVHGFSSVDTGGQVGALVVLSRVQRSSLILEILVVKNSLNISVRVTRD